MINEEEFNLALNSISNLMLKVLKINIITGKYNIIKIDDHELPKSERAKKNIFAWADEFMEERNVVNGFAEDGTFRPGDFATREQTATILNNFFGLENGFKIRNPNKPESENSATIVWNCLDKLETLPLIWNSFPFHPHNKDNQNSNRAPTGEELKQGKIILEELIGIFEIKKNHIIPIGQNAAKILKEYEIPRIIRHPSHGGKDDFITGMEAIFN